MYVCVCHALTDQDIMSAQAKGAARCSDVFRLFGLKRQCGRCAQPIHGLMNCEGRAAPPPRRRPKRDEH